jgi:hypothetical protein
LNLLHSAQQRAPACDRKNEKKIVCGWCGSPYSPCSEGLTNPERQSRDFYIMPWLCE